MVTWRAYSLDLKDYEIFLSLKKNPLQSNADIGRTVGLSSESVRSRIHAMKSKGFLRDDRTINDLFLGPRKTSESTGIYQPRRLGLQRQHVLLKGISNRSAQEALKIVCDEHPYAHYYVPAYGEASSLYIQFDIPPKTLPSMKRLYNDLKKRGYFSDYFIVDELYCSICSADFSKWDAKRDVWQVGQKEKKWYKQSYSDFEEIWKRIEDTNVELEMPKTEPAKSYEFDNLDMLLLRELTINSKPVMTNISKSYSNNSRLNDEFKKDSTTLARRVSKLRENIVTRDLLYYDRRVFDLTYPQLISGTFTNSTFTPESLYKFISSGALPFEIMAFSDTKSFLMYTTTPPSIAPEISELLWDHAQDISVHQLQFDSSLTYYFYHENYVDGDWRADEHYVLQEPLSKV